MTVADGRRGGVEGRSREWPVVGYRNHFLPSRRLPPFEFPFGFPPGKAAKFCGFEPFCLWKKGTAAPTHWSRTSRTHSGSQKRASGRTRPVITQSMLVKSKFPSEIDQMVPKIEPNRRRDRPQSINPVLDLRILNACAHPNMHWQDNAVLLQETRRIVLGRLVKTWKIWRGSESMILMISITNAGSASGWNRSDMEFTKMISPRGRSCGLVNTLSLLH